MFKLSPGERDLVRQTLVVWLVIVILNYHLMLIDTWVPVLGGLAVWGVTLLFGSLFGLALVGRLLWGRRWLPAAIACVSMAAASAVPVWPGLFVTTFYATNVVGFAAVAKLADAHRLDLDGYYGGKLPFPLRQLSINGRAARLTPIYNAPPIFDPTKYPAPPERHPEWVFLPRWMGLLDGAVGYAYLPDPPPRGTAFDGFGDAVFVCRSLGSDWYWVTRRGGSC